MKRLAVRNAAAALCAGVALIASPQLGRAQAAPGAPGDAPPGILPGVKMGGSPNMHLVGHLPLGGYFRVMDDEIEQDPNRPYGVRLPVTRPARVYDHRPPRPQQRQSPLPLEHREP